MTGKRTCDASYAARYSHCALETKWFRGPDLADQRLCCVPIEPMRIRQKLAAPLTVSVPANQFCQCPCQPSERNTIKKQFHTTTNKSTITVDLSSCKSVENNRFVALVVVVDYSNERIFLEVKALRCFNMMVVMCMVHHMSVTLVTAYYVIDGNNMKS